MKRISTVPVPGLTGQETEQETAPNTGAPVLKTPVLKTADFEAPGSRAQPERFESKRDDVARKIKGLECDRRSKVIDLHSKVRGPKALGTTALATLLGLAVLSVSTVSIAQFNVDLSGRVDFLVKQESAFTDQITVTAASNSAAFTSMGMPVAVFADDAALQSALNAAGGTNSVQQGKDSANPKAAAAGRLDLRVSHETATLDYGTFVRLDIESDADRAVDADAHAFVTTGYGRLSLGTDLDGLQSVFDTSHISAGPLHPGKTVAFGGSFDDMKNDEISLAYQSPTLLGARFDAEAEREGDWNASVSYRNSLGESDLALVLGGNSNAGLGAYIKGDYGDFTVLGFYMQDGDREKAGGAGVAFHTGPFTVSAETSIARSNELVGTGLKGINGVSSVNVRSSGEHSETDVVIGAAYDVSSGLEISGAVALIENERSGQAVNAQGRLRIKF